MAKRRRVHGEDEYLDPHYDNWTLPEVMNHRRGRVENHFQDEVDQDFAASAPWYESRSVDGAYG